MLLGHWFLRSLARWRREAARKGEAKRDSLSAERERSWAREADRPSERPVASTRPAAGAKQKGRNNGEVGGKHKTAQREGGWVLPVRQLSRGQLAGSEGPLQAQEEQRRTSVLKQQGGQGEEAQEGATNSQSS